MLWLEVAGTTLQARGGVWLVNTFEEAFLQFLIVADGGGGGGAGRPCHAYYWFYSKKLGTGGIIHFVLKSRMGFIIKTAAPGKELYTMYVLQSVM